MKREKTKKKSRAECAILQDVDQEEREARLQEMANLVYKTRGKAIHYRVIDHKERTVLFYDNKGLCIYRKTYAERDRQMVFPFPPPPRLTWLKSGKC